MYIAYTLYGSLFNPCGHSRLSLKKRQAKRLHRHQNLPAMMSGYHLLIASVQEMIQPTHTAMKDHHPNVVDMIMTIDHRVMHPKNPEEKVNETQHENHHDLVAIQVVIVIMDIVVSLHQRINLVSVIMLVKLFEKQLETRLILAIPTVIRHHEIQEQDYQKNHQEVQGKNEGQVVIDDQPMLAPIQQQQQVDHPILQHLSLIHI